MFNLIKRLSKTRVVLYIQQDKNLVLKRPREGGGWQQYLLWRLKPAGSTQEEVLSIEQSLLTAVTQYPGT